MDCEFPSTLQDLCSTNLGAKQIQHENMNPNKLTFWFWPRDQAGQQPDVKQSFVL